MEGDVLVNPGFAAEKMIGAVLFIALAALGAMIFVARLLITRVVGEMDKRFAEHDLRLMNAETGIAKIAERVAIIDSQLSHLPSHEDLKRVHGRLDSISETLSELKGAYHASNRTLILIQEHLVSGGGK